MDKKEKGGQEEMQKIPERNGKGNNITPEQRDKMIKDIMKRRRKLFDRLSST